MHEPVIAVRNENELCGEEEMGMSFARRGK
jgi:hypothetical protein